VFARITAWSREDALRVPLSALFRNGASWSVFKIGGSRAVLTGIDVGRRNPEYAEVLGGLSPGDRVVLHPSDRVKQGTRVRQITAETTR